MEVVKKALFWFLTAFSLLFALVFLPSFSSVLFLIVAVLTAPISKLQEIRNRFLPKRKIKVLLGLGLFFVGIFCVPSAADSAPEPPSVERTQVVENVATPTPEPTPTVAPTSNPTASPAPVPAATPTPKPVVTATPSPTTTPKPTATAAPTEAPAKKIDANTPDRIYAGGDYLVWLRSDGTVTGAGYLDGHLKELESWADIVDIAVASSHTLGLRSDGTVVAIGPDTYSAAGMDDIVQIAAGRNHTVVVHEDGHASLMGYSSKLVMSCFEELENITQVSIGSEHSAAMNADGQWFVAGSTVYDKESLDWQRPLKKIVCGAGFTLGLGEDGTVQATGANNYGQINTSEWKKIVDVAAGTAHSVGLCSDGTVVATGDNSRNQCNVEGWTNMVSIVCGNYFTAGIREDGCVLFTTHSTVYGNRNGETYFIAEKAKDFSVVNEWELSDPPKRGDIALAQEKNTGIAKDHAATETPENSTFEIHFLDVGQGDAALVLCDGKSMLIDGGESEASDIIYSHLKEHNITHLDYIVATHAHEDHVGGLAGALNFATVDTAFCSVTEYDSKAFSGFVKYLDKQDVEITVPTAGDTFALGSASVEIIGPITATDDADNSSIVLRIVYGDTSFIFTGDADYEEEHDILSAGNAIESTVLKVGHHGSDDSTSYAFLREVAPEFAIVSVGEENTYGHPTEATLSRLCDADVTVYRTDLQGDIICTSDGETVSFNVEKNADADTFLPIVPEVIEPTATPEPVEKSAVPEGTEYVVNKNTRKFHYPHCSSVDSMKESNKWFYVGTREELVGKGYDPCGRCHP